MAVLIPALGSCVSCMTAGERRLAERLEDKLDADYMLWYELPVGPKRMHLDCAFIPSEDRLKIFNQIDWKPTRLQVAIAEHGEDRRGRKYSVQPNCTDKLLDASNIEFDAGSTNDVASKANHLEQLK